MSTRNACRLLAVSLVALLGACASEPEAVAPGDQVRMMADLRAGKLTLACGVACRDDWRRQVRIVSTLDHAEHWSDLALRIMRIGYGSDLAYFYLGQASRGMGYDRAAIGYYQQARAVADSSDTAMQCAGGNTSEDRCFGVRIGNAAPALAEAAREALTREMLDEAVPLPATRPNRAKTKALLAAKHVQHPGRSGSAAGQVAGLAQAIDTGTLQVQGRTIPLDGVVGRPDAYAAQLQALIDGHGTTVHCVKAGSGYACTLRNGLDVARAAVASGIATVAADAPDALRLEQQAARAARRGLWKTEANVSG